MNFEDLRDRLIELKEKILNFLEEDPSVNSAKEKFETFPPLVQKTLVGCTLLVTVLSLIYIPYSFFSTAAEYEEEFNNYRSTTRELLKVGRGSGSSVLTQRGNLESLQQSLTSALAKFNLMDEQLQEVLLTTPTGGSLTKPPVQEEALLVRLNKLNLDQIVQISVDLQKQFRDLKMTGMSIIADASGPGYFNLQLQLSKYYLPEVEDKDDKKTPKRNFRQRSTDDADNN